MYLDLLSIFIAAIVYYIIGAIWYSPLLFGEVWGRLAKVNFKQMKNKSTLYIVSFISSLIQAFFLALLLDNLKIITTLDAIIVGLFIVVGFVFTTELAPVLWLKKPLRLYFIEISYRLVGFIAMSVILAV